MKDKFEFSDDIIDEFEEVLKTETKPNYQISSVVSLQEQSNLNNQIESNAFNTMPELNDLSSSPIIKTNNNQIINQKNILRNSKSRSRIIYPRPSTQSTSNINSEIRKASLEINNKKDDKILNLEELEKENSKLSNDVSKVHYHLSQLIKQQNYKTIMEKQEKDQKENPGKPLPVTMGGIINEQLKLLKIEVTIRQSIYELNKRSEMAEELVADSTGGNIIKDLKENIKKLKSDILKLTLSNTQGDRKINKFQKIENSCSDNKLYINELTAIKRKIKEVEEQISQVDIKRFQSEEELKTLKAQYFKLNPSLEKQKSEMDFKDNNLINKINEKIKEKKDLQLRVNLAEKNFKSRLEVGLNDLAMERQRFLVFVKQADEQEQVMTKQNEFLKNEMNPQKLDKIISLAYQSLKDSRPRKFYPLFDTRNRKWADEEIQAILQRSVDKEPKKKEQFIKAINDDNYSKEIFVDETQNSLKCQFENKDHTEFVKSNKDSQITIIQSEAPKQLTVIQNEKINTELIINTTSDEVKGHSKRFSFLKTAINTKKESNGSASTRDESPIKHSKNKLKEQEKPIENEITPFDVHNKEGTNVKQSDSSWLFELNRQSQDSQLIINEDSKKILDFEDGLLFGKKQSENQKPIVINSDFDFLD